MPGKKCCFPAFPAMQNLPFHSLFLPHRGARKGGFGTMGSVQQRLGIIKERIMGAADLVAEVLSPESRRRDRIDKRDLYEQHGVREYWLIDPEAKTVEVLHLDSGTYQLAGRWHPGERARSRLLKGFEVPVSPLFGAA